MKCALYRYSTTGPAPTLGFCMPCINCDSFILTFIWVFISLCFAYPFLARYWGRADLHRGSRQPWPSVFSTRQIFLYFWFLSPSFAPLVLVDLFCPFYWPIIDFLVFDSKFRVLICSQCKYALAPGTFNSHLSSLHKNDVTRSDSGLIYIQRCCS